MTTEPVRLSLAEVAELAAKAFASHGVSTEQARAVVDTVTAAERDGCQSHGLFRVPGYLASVRSGKVVPDAVPVVAKIAPGVIKVDGAGGFSPLAIERGRALLVETARSQGIAAEAITNAHHFAAVWPEVEALADQGLVAFAFVSSMSFVAPAGGTEALYGTNPMAFGWPRAGAPPLVFDQSSSASARGEILLHLRDGLPLPDGWGIDADGHPSNDPASVLAGAQLPFGGYKGAAIALMVELLAGALVGEVFSFEATERDNHDGGPSSGGELIVAIDPSRCVDATQRNDQLRHAEHLFARILDQEGTRLPSDRRYANRLRTPSEGVEIPGSLHEELLALART